MIWSWKGFAWKLTRAVMQWSVLQLYKNVQGLVSEKSNLLEQNYSNPCAEMAHDFLTNLEKTMVVFSPSLFLSISTDTPPTDLWWDSHVVESLLGHL